MHLYRFLTLLIASFGLGFVGTLDAALTTSSHQTAPPCRTVDGQDYHIGGQLAVAVGPELTLNLTWAEAGMASYVSEDFRFAMLMYGRSGTLLRNATSVKNKFVYIIYLHDGSDRRYYVKSDQMCSAGGGLKPKDIKSVVAQRITVLRE